MFYDRLYLFLFGFDFFDFRDGALDWVRLEFFDRVGYVVLLTRFVRLALYIVWLFFRIERLFVRGFWDLDEFDQAAFGVLHAVDYWGDVWGFNSVLFILALVIGAWRAYGLTSLDCEVI